jgi:Mg/Co/Ni transporter MgtE
MRTVPSIPSDATIADAARAIADERWPVPVTNAAGVLLGAVEPAALGLPSDTRVERIMVPAPSTIRPELRVGEARDRLDDDGLDHVFVTAVNGTLLGLAVTAELHL